MMLSPTGLVFAAIFLALGLVELVIFSKVIYPSLSRRHEAEKVIQSQGRGPALVVNVIRFQSLVIMPIIGYVVGSVFMSSGAP